MTSTQMLQDLYVGVLLTLMIVVVARNFKISVWFYIIHSFLMSFIFIWYGYFVGNQWFYLWAFSTMMFRVVIIPFAPGGLFYSIKRLMPREVKPILTFGPSLLFISALVVATWWVFHTYVYLIATNSAILEEPARTNLAIAFTVFVLGLYTLLTRRDAIKTVLGLAIMENGIHLTLVDLTPTMSETVILGLLTSVTVALFILLYLGRLIFLQHGVRDTVDLSELRY